MNLLYLFQKAGKNIAFGAFLALGATFGCLGMAENPPRFIGQRSLFAGSADLGLERNPLDLESLSDEEAYQAYCEQQRKTQEATILAPPQQRVRPIALTPTRLAVPTIKEKQKEEQERRNNKMKHIIAYDIRQEIAQYNNRSITPQSTTSATPPKRILSPSLAMRTYEEERKKTPTPSEKKLVARSKSVPLPRTDFLYSVTELPGEDQQAPQVKVTRLLSPEDTLTLKAITQSSIHAGNLLNLERARAQHAIKHANAARQISASAPATLETAFHPSTASAFSKKQPQDVLVEGRRSPSVTNNLVSPIPTPATAFRAAAPAERDTTQTRCVPACVIL